MMYFAFIRMCDKPSPERKVSNKRSSKSRNKKRNCDHQYILPRLHQHLVQSTQSNIGISQELN